MVKFTTMITATRKKAREKLGANIKAALDGRTQRWLADKIGMPDDYLSNKLKGKFRINDNELAKINGALGTSFENV